MENNNGMGMTPFEQFMLAEKTSRHRAGGTAITGLVLGSIGAALGIGAWIFAPLYANARVKSAESQNAGTAALLSQIAGLLATERQERVAGDINLTATINDSVSGSQQGQLTASQIAQQEQAQQLALGLMTGKYSENPTKVQLYSAPQPCPCPGCGCNG